MNAIMLLGIDLAKNVFQLHGVDGQGVCWLRRQVRRAQLLRTIAQMPRCTIAMEACSGAHDWGSSTSRRSMRVICVRRSLLSVRKSVGFRPAERLIDAVLKN